VRVVLATTQITVFQQLAYSSDLTPNDLFLFPKVKELLKGIHFDDIDDISRNTTPALQIIPQIHSEIVLKGWTWRCHQCIASQGEYFEGNHGGFQQ
jgi:hypothetical protein